MLDRIEELREAAKEGFPEAAWALGIMLEHGYGLAANLQEAVRYYRQAAERGLAPAQFDLARLYLSGDTAVERNPDRGVELCRLAAQQGLSYAQYFLGSLSSGDNIDEAVKWFEAAANSGSAQAATLLGTMYEMGSGVRKDINLSIRWFERGDSLGSPSAPLHLARIHEAGKEGSANEKLALEYYKRAKERGNPVASLYLMSAYEQGKLGLSRDPAEADKHRSDAEQLRLAAKERRTKLLRRFRASKDD